MPYATVRSAKRWRTAISAWSTSPWSASPPGWRWGLESLAPTAASSVTVLQEREGQGWRRGKGAHPLRILGAMWGIVGRSERAHQGPRYVVVEEGIWLTQKQEGSVTLSQRCCP